MTYTDFDADGLADEVAFALALFLTLMAIADLVQSYVGSDDPATHTEQAVTLNEDALRRLEDGDSVVVHRWHGSDLELAGTQVIDVEPVDETED